MDFIFGHVGEPSERAGCSPFMPPDLSYCLSPPLPPARQFPRRRRGLLSTIPLAQWCHQWQQEVLGAPEPKGSFLVLPRLGCLGSGSYCHTTTLSAMWSYRRKVELSIRATGSRGIASAAAAAAAGLEWGGEALGRTGER